jgi:uncharacterized protein
MAKEKVKPQEIEEEKIERINVFDSTLREMKDKMPPLRFSKFVHEFRNNKTVALYHSLTQQVVYLNEEFYQELKKNINEKKTTSEQQWHCVKELIERGFLVSIEYEENKILERIREKHLGKPVFGILYLLLTDMCNLRCRYCYIEGAMPAGHSFSMMSRETAIKAINLFARLISNNPLDRTVRHPIIIFYGGEPLLNKEVFLAALNEIDRLKKSSELPSNLIISLVTNTTLVDEEIVNAIVEKGVSVSVSLDGPKDLHDANRRFANGKGTFQKVVENMQWLQKAGAKVSTSVTISPANIDQLEGVLKWLISEFQIRSLGFNMLLDLPELTQADENYARKATEKLINCYQIAREIGVYEDRIMRKIKAFVGKSLHLVDCGGCGNQIVVTPDGKIGPCHAYMGSGKFFPTYIDDKDFDYFHDPVFLEWSRRSPFNIPKCQFCSAIGLCGGGCPYNAELKFGNIWEVDPNFCLHTKIILEWLIWDLFDKTKTAANVPSSAKRLDMGS